MIVRIRGTLIENHGHSLVVDCHGIGYEVLVPTSVAFQFALESTVNLYVRQIFREDGQSLFGFLTSEDRRIFDLLRDVKGCGPKTSLAVLGELGDSGALSAILNQEVKALTRVNGIGLRLAERIIVELKDKVQAIDIDRKFVSKASQTAVVSDELVDALVTLGYRKTEAEAAAEVARAEADDVPDQLRIALKRLTR